MTILGSAYVEIRAIDTHLKRDIEAAAKKIKDITVTVKADVDLAPVRSSIAALRAEVNKNPLKFTSELDDDGVVDGILKAHQLAEDNALKLNTEVDDFGVRFGLLAAQELYKDNPLTLETHPDTTLLETELERIHREYGTMVSNILPNAVTGVAERQLNRAARTRIAHIRANVSILNDKQINDAVKGFRNALTGMIPPEAIKNSITGLFGNLEGLAVKGALVVTAIGSIASSITTLGANILTVSGGILESIGILAMAPALLYGGVSMILGTKMAWKGYFDAFDEDVEKAEKAIAKLPPQAQVAARAFRGFWGQIQKSAQSKYWEEMGTALQEHLLGGLDELIEGFDKVSVAGAKMTKGLTRAWFEFQSTGRMSKVFDNIATGMTNAKDALGNFLEGFNIFATVGSEYLPAFGTWVDGLSTKFKNWSEEAERTGKMNRWIEDAVSSLQDMGSILSSSGSILKGFTIISDLSGGKSLNDMANGMRNIADIINGEPFRSRMVNVFTGAREGMDALGEGIGDLMEVMGRGHRTISEFLAITGEIGGTVLTNFASMGEGTNLGAGLIKFLQGAKTAAQDIKPAFKDAGDIIGNLGEIGATLLTSLAPGLNKLFDTLNKAIEAMMDGIIAAIPVFNEFIQSVVEVLAPIVIGLAEAFGNLLEAFAALPDPIRNLIMWVGLLGLALYKFSGFMTGVRAGLNGVGQSMRETAQKHFTPFLRSLDGVKNGFRDVGDKARVFGSSLDSAMRTTARPFMDRLRDMNRAVRDFGSGVAAGMREAAAESEMHKVREGFQRTGEGISNSFRQMGDGIRRGASDIGAGLRATADQAGFMVRSMGESIPGGTRALDGLRNTAQNLATNFRDNMRSMGDSMDQFRTRMGPVGGALGDLRRAVGDTMGAVGGSVNKGLRGAIGGLSDALGGPWGAALAGAAIGISLYASHLAEVKQQVDDVADSLDQFSGRATHATEKVLAGLALDGVTDGWDDFWRGQWHGAQSTEETLAQLGISTEKYIDIVKDPKAVGQFVKDLNKAGDALRAGVPVTDEMAAALKMTKEELSGMDAESLTYLADKAEHAAEVLAKAQKKTAELGKALGVSSAAAAIMQANWDTLSNTASTASQRFQALKQNLELLSDAQDKNSNKSQSAVNAQKTYYETLDQVSESMATLFQGNKEAVRSLYDLEKGFDVTTKAGRDLHTNVTSQSDAILQLGTAAMDKALKSGKGLTEAQKIAIDTMQPAIDTLKQSLSDWGMEEAQVNSIIESLGLVPEDLTVALGVEGGDKARQEIFLTQLAADSFANRNYEGVLAALPDPAKAAIEEVLGLSGAFDGREFEAILKAMDESGVGREAFLANILSVAGPDVDYVAELEAMDLTPPVVESARKGINSVVAPEWKANLTAQDATAFGTNSTKVSLNNLIAQQYEAKLTARDATAAGRSTASGNLNRTTVGTDWIAPIKARDSTGPVLGEVKRNFNGFVTTPHVATLSARKDSGAFAAVDRDLDLVARARTATITVVSVNGGATSNPNHVVRPGQVGAMANGGIIPNMSNMFAGKIPPVKAFASGGFENHVAQISRGQTPFRIWSEPETGGEAYLPLAKSKRPRSEKILEEVARIFGFSLIKKMSFADGGILSGFDTGRKSGVSVNYGTSSPSAPKSTVIQAAGAPNVTMNVYPSTGLSEEQIGQSAMNHMFWKLNTM